MPNLTLTPQQSTDINSTLEGIKSKALTLSSTLSSMGGQGSPAATSTPTSTSGIDYGATNKSLGADLAGADSDTQTILGKYADQKTLAASQAADKAKGITADYGDQIDTAKDENAQSMTAEEESRRGFATNNAIVQHLQQTGDKRIASLQKTRDSLLLQNDYDKASAISDLITKEQQTITDARQKHFENALALNKENRDQASFQTPDQKQMSDLKAQYADVPGVQDAQDVPSLLKAIGPRLSEDRKYAIAKQDADLTLERAQTTLAQANATKALNDAKNGVLDATDLAKVDSSPEGKKISGLNDLKSSLTNYKNLVDTYGVQITGASAKLLDSAYADLVVKWKNAAQLGVLSSSDYNLINQAIQPATGFGGIGAWLTGGGTAGIQNNLQSLIDRVNTQGSDAYNQLLKRDSRYKNSEYVQGLGDYFKTTDNKSLNAPAKPTLPSLTNQGSTQTGVPQGNMFSGVNF